jgi:hypothetical protein
VTGVRASGWHNGGQQADPAGYGIKFTKADRDRSFDPDWDHVVLDLEGAEQVTVPLAASFWRSCSELRSAAIGRWLLESGAAPWAHGTPPGIVVTPVESNHLSAHVLKRYNFL